MSDQRSSVHAAPSQSFETKKKYTPPKLTVLGKVDELTLGHENAPKCDAPLPGGGDVSCS